MIQAQIVIDRFLRNEHSYLFMLNAYERLLLVMLASYTGNKTNCFPSHQSLSRDCGMSIDSVKRSLKSLENKSLVKTFRSIGINNHYELTIPSANGTQCLQHLEANSITNQMPSTPTPSADSPSNNISNNINEYTSLVSSHKRPAKLAKKQLSLPNNLKINDSHKIKASHLELNVESEFEHFKEHHIAKGSRFADWGMAFHTWLRNAAKFSQKNKISNETNIMAGVGHE